MERVHSDNWTLAPSVFPYNINWRPPDYVTGLLAESWNFTDPNTFIVHLRKGIHWQNIPPVNGREFIADDVVYHWDRYLGLGSGMKGSTYYNAVAVWQNLASVTTNDKYTVVFKWKISNPEFIMETMQGAGHEQCIEAHEAVEQWGDLSDWHHAIGTGPFILTDFVSGSSLTVIKNPNYWGYDERYPQNRLPYIDTLKILIIPDQATTMAALRTSKVDFMDGISSQQAQSTQKTNPEILQLTYPAGNCLTVDPRNDTVPFNDIRVRKAMQMSIDLPSIASNYYGGITQPYPSSITSRYETGWGFPYTEWPQDLKDEYAYNLTQAKALLAAAGYASGFKTDLVINNAADMNLFQIVMSVFAAVGIDMDIRPMDAAAWNLFVRARKQDALASSSDGAVGLSYEPTRQLNRFATNVSVNWMAVSDPVFDAFYGKAMAATSVDDIKKVIRDMNEYAARQHFIISLLTPTLFALYQPWLKGYSAQNFSLSGVSTGPLQIGFYASRFWIDQNLKKAMGH